LTFQVNDAEVQPFAASPQMTFRLGVANAVSNEPVHTVVLRCQIQIEATRRAYSAADKDRLVDLFGAPARWGETLRTMLWTHTSAVVPSFVGETVVDLPVPCTFDFNVAAAKYFAGLEDGEVPLCLQFSGTIFYDAPGWGLQVAQIPWNKEARYRLPIAVWRAMIDAYYPNSAWLCLHRDAFDRLYEYKRRRGMATWEQALESLLEGVDEEARR
jgi:hypothetical protein